ncbi:MAG: hypothetical protein ACXVGO_16310 [Mycobacterium sp.]
MNFRYRRVASGVKAIGLLVVSIMITAASLAALLVDTLTPPRLSAAASTDCLTVVYPVEHTIAFVTEHRCPRRG